MIKSKKRMNNFLASVRKLRHICNV